MLLPTLVVLTAAPVHLFVYSGVEAPNPAQLMKKYDADAKVINAGGIYGLFHTGLLFEDFDGFNRAPPKGWPEELAPAWTEAMAYCRGTLGPPPWKGSNAPLICSQRITEFLWQKYFAFTHADRVFFVNGFFDAGLDTDEVTGTTFTPGENVEHFILLKGHAKDFPGHLDQAISALMKPDLLQRQPRVVAAALPALNADQKAKATAPRDPFAGRKASSEPVKLAKECDAMPVSLSVTPASVVGAALESRWMASAKGRAPTASCTLDLTTHEEAMGPPLPSTVTVVGATVTCGTATASAEAMQQSLGRNPVDLMTERLLTGLAKSFCR